MKVDDVQVVLLAGGLGTRIREETANKPKPMIEIGGYPILWHMMKNFSSFGLRRFVICTGYKSEVIVDYFSNYKLRNYDFTLNLGKESKINIHDQKLDEEWEIVVSHTGGPEVGTGGRIKRVEKYIDSDRFICTYGDGLSNIDIKSLLKHHISHQQIATVSVINPTNRFGVVQVTTDNQVTSFKEKPASEGWVNAGFFVFTREVFEFLEPTITLESEPLQKLASLQQLNAYRHTGFWQAMDTFREYEQLENLWKTGKAPWKNW